MKDEAIEELEAQKIAMFAAHNLKLYDRYAAIQRELEQLRVVGKHAARIYKDHSDEEAWNLIFIALSDAGLL